MNSTEGNPTFSCAYHAELDHLIVKYYFRVMLMKYLVKSAVFLYY